jgi:hypothetical protein
MANALPTSGLRTRLSEKARLMITMGGNLRAAVALSILLVALLRLYTPVARPVNDGTEYLKIASAGLDPQAQLAAPFVYRFAVPLVVHGMSVLTGANPVVIFPQVALLTCVFLLIATYVVARLTAASRGYALVTILLIACSLFIIRFPLYFPYAVDVEALLVCFLAFALLLQRSYISALIVSLIGLLFKEFLLVPLVVLVVLFFIQYLRDRTNRPLLWTILSLALTCVVFLLPRLLIPVTYSFGTILRVKASAPDSMMYLSELRHFLNWPPQLGTPVNVLLALASFWLPALMLSTPARLRTLWQALGTTNRVLVIVWMGGVVALTLVGGTNIMIFVTYSAPILVFVLSLLFRSGVSKAEVAAVLVASLLFNRMIFGFGTPDGGLDSEIDFYGAYWHLLDGVTVWRLAEVAGWMFLGWGTRQMFRAVPTVVHEIEPG